MTLMNLLVGKEWTHKCREWPYTGGCMEKVASTCTHDRVWDGELMGSCCAARGAQPQVVTWRGEGEGGKGYRNNCGWPVVLEETAESPLDCKEIQPVHPKGDQSWVFIGRTDVEAETPILWPPHAKSWLIRKDPYAGRDWGQEEKGMTEDEMVRWHHRLNGHEFGWTPGVVDGQGALACCGSWGRKELDMTVRLNCTEYTQSTV